MDIWLQTDQNYPNLPVGTSIAEFENISKSDGDTIHFSGRITGAGIDASNDFIIAKADQAGAITLLFQEGSLFNGDPVTLATPHPSPFFTDNTISFFADHQGKQSLVCLSSSGNLEIPLKPDQPLTLPDGPITIKQLHPDQLMVSGERIVTKVGLEPSGEALLLITKGMIRPLALDGWDLPHNGGNVTIASTALNPSQGPSSGINDNGKAAFVITTTGNEELLLTIEDVDNLDGDNFSDTLEIAFGGNPDQPDTASPAGLPRLTTTNSGTPILEFWVNTSPAVNLDYTIQESHNLVDWTPVTPEILSSPDQTGVSVGYEKRYFEVNVDQTEKFYRFVF